MGAATTTLKTLTGLAAAGFGWGLLENNLFTVRRLSLPVLPAGKPSIKVLHISDIHLHPGQPVKLAFLRSLAVLEPDLVINTGDNLAHPAAVEPLVDALADLRGIPGVFVFGSNDYTGPRLKNPLSYLLRSTAPASTASAASPAPKAKPASFHPNLPWAELRYQFEQLGWQDLNNQRCVRDVRGIAVQFAGTDDAHISRDDYAAVAGPASPGTELTVGVTHAPYRRVLDAMTRDGADVIFAGHTHGGQVCVPGYGALVTNCDLPADRVKGLSRHIAGDRRAWLHVSAGLGGSPYAPYRFACRPEATLLTLTARDS